ncbi:entry exclusion lipoprotein TrbK [Salinicola aestuarinus]|uniref:entry exclusion lipoprotein TrbK n=1 Tax=Salinicola aestuarinus TaxID=1949082 RepID=UPI000DA213CF|nr:entry exclusion lipoprotein TrbK [Salinicola aestuarinus]
MKTLIASTAITVSAVLLTGCGLPEPSAENCQDPEVGEQYRDASREDQMKFVQECQKILMGEAFKNAQ